MSLSILSFTGLIRCSFHAAGWGLGASLLLWNPAIAPATWANEPVVQEIRLAQAQFTVDQLPMSRLRNARQLEYGDRVNRALNLRSTRHQGRRFAIYRFEGEAGQLIRISLVGGLERDRPPEQLQTGELLISPVVILLDPNREIIAQQPETADVAAGLIRMTLPTTGTYHIFVTSALIGGGGRYILTLQELAPSALNPGPDGNPF